MAIVNIQRRLHERGRIRIGQTVPTSNGKTRPAKLDRFRLTSADRSAIDAAAALWGGNPKPWESPNGSQWEVVTDTADIAVMLPPGDLAFSQFYETWSGGGAKRRCDGDTEFISGGACLCDQEDQRTCKPTTRLSVILPELPGVGLWRLESHGWYAASELAGTVALMGSLFGSDLVPAWLRLQQRSVKRPKVNGDGVETIRYAVPVLDIAHRLGELTTGGNGGALVGVSEARAVTAGELASPSFTPVPESLPEAPTPSVKEQMAAVASPPQRKPRRTAAAPLPATGLKPRTAAEAAAIDQAQQRHPSGNPLCLHCEQPIIGSVSVLGPGEYKHRDGCPQSGGDAPLLSSPEGGVTPADPLPVGATPTLDLGGEADVREASAGSGSALGPAGPSSPPNPLGGEPPLVAGGDNSPPNQLAGDDEVRLVGILAGKVLRPWFDKAPKGKKTETVDRIRHTLTQAVTGHTSLKQCTSEELVKVDRELRMIERGDQTLEVLEDGISLTNKGGTEQLIEWAAE